MYDFVKSRRNLRKILENTEVPTSGAPTAYAKSVQIDQAIQNALQLVPEHLPYATNGDATIVIRASSVLAVQQYVTLFGCHLEYKHKVDHFSSRYVVVPNWK